MYYNRTMDALMWANFISSLVGSLAWPVVVLVIVLLLRHRILGLIPSIRELQIGNLAIKFKEQVKELGEEAEKTIPALPERTAEVEGLDTIWKLAEISPRSSIIEAWRVVETEARRALRAAGMYEMQEKYLPPARMGHSLARREVIDSKLSDLFNELRLLRNRAAHSQAFSIDEDVARDYIRTAMGIAGRLREYNAQHAP